MSQSMNIAGHQVTGGINKKGNFALQVDRPSGAPGAHIVFAHDGKWIEITTPDKEIASGNMAADGGQAKRVRLS